MNILHESWKRMTHDQDQQDDFIDLVCRYSDSTRYYHTLEHIRELIQGALVSDYKEDAALHRAIWWHDAIYDTTRHDNEERSADQAALRLAAWGEPEAEIERVRTLILITRTHQIPEGDPIAAKLIDLDLSILAARREKY